MIWIEKYKPKSFKEMDSHEEVVSMLQNYTLETLPNLIIHGQSGHNKKTILYCLIENLFGKYPEPKAKTIEVEAGASTLQVNFLETDEIIEMCPSEYGNRDRVIIQSIIKEMAQTRPILGMFGNAKKTVKVLIIDQAEELSKDAQAALRRTMDVYSGHFRIILLCSETSKLIDPIKSRCLLLRMRGFNYDEVESICKNILVKEEFSVSENVIKDIYVNSKGDCKRVLCLLEIYCFNNENNDAKRVKIDQLKLKLEWESKIDQIVDLVKRSPKPETMLPIRKELYSLLGSYVDPHIILLYLFNGLCKNLPFELCKSLSAFALGYEERMILGSKAIYHLEAFLASAMNVLVQRR